MTRLRKERVEEIVRLLRRMYPKAACSLDFRTPFQLLVATILSAQSTDARVNMVTPHLFEKYPTVEAMASAQSYELEQVIHATGFFRNKAKSVIGAARAILERHGGQVPQTMEELMELPGVGRKTANVVLSNAFGKPVGIVVDTHVARVSVRLALTGQSDPVRIEEDLMALIPKKEWTSFAHRMILHGREICLARKPKCAECRLNEICPSAQEALN
jgi:endonuclease-3